MSIPEYEACQAKCVEEANELFEKYKGVLLHDWQYYYDNCDLIYGPINNPPSCGALIAKPPPPAPSLPSATCAVDCAVWAAKKVADEAWNPLVWGLGKEWEESLRIKCQVESRCINPLTADRATLQKASQEVPKNYLAAAAVAGVAVAGIWLLKRKRKGR